MKAFKLLLFLVNMKKPYSPVWRKQRERGNVTVVKTKKKKKKKCCFFMFSISHDPFLLLPIQAQETQMLLDRLTL